MNAMLQVLDDPYELVHTRLVQWGRDKFYPGWAEPSPSAVLGRLMDEGRDERSRRYRGRTKLMALMRRIGGAGQMPCKETRGIRMELLVYQGGTVMCRPDGGMSEMVVRMAGAIERSRECREIGEVLVQLQDYNQKLWHVVRETYRDAMNPSEIPRRGAGAAQLLKIAESTYWARRKKAQAWIGRRVFPDRAEEFLTDGSESV